MKSIVYIFILRYVLIFASDMKTYVTGSVDKTCKLWDIRDEKAKQTFFGHDADVNSVCVSNLKYKNLPMYLIKNM